MSDEIIQHYTEAQDEEARLADGIGRWEYERTIALISQYLGQKQTVVDVGRGTGVYSLWIAEQGHDVHVVDLVPRHVEMVRDPIAVIKQLDDWVDKKGRMYELAVKYAQMVEDEEELLGASFHLLGVGRRL